MVFQHQLETRAIDSGVFFGYFSLNAGVEPFRRRYYETLADVFGCRAVGFGHTCSGRCGR